MPAQSSAQEQGRKETGRARRKAAQEQAARRQQFIWLGGAIAVALVVALVLILLNRPQAQDIGATIVAAAPLPPAIPATGSILGAADAPVSIVEWGDYQCPGCGIFAREVAPRLIAEYVEPGLASFEFRDFSFLGEESFRAAEAAACAADQGAYWPFHDTLYANQRGENQNAFSDLRLKEIAKVLSLDSEAFNTCLDSGEKRAQVDQSAADAREEGINSTPSLFIDGTRVEDWRNWEAVKTALDAALAKE
jgi:protein-disulfide isomerase